MKSTDAVKALKLGPKLKKIRQSYEYPVSFMAKGLNVERGTIVMIENGIRNCTLNNLILWHKMCPFSYDELLCDNSEQDRNIVSKDVSYYRIKGLLERLSQDEIEIVLELLFTYIDKKK